MDDNTGVSQLLDDLLDLLEDSKPAFGRGGGYRTVEIAAAFDIIDEIKTLFPGEFSQARQIVRERDALLEGARKEASNMISDAQHQAVTIASQQEIVRISQQQAESIMAEAREMERQVRSGAEDYAYEVFSNIEQNLGSMLNNIQRCRERINSNS